MKFLDHILRHNTVGTAPLDEWSVLRSDIHLTIHITHKRQISLLPVGFETTISVVEGRQTYALDRAATRIDSYKHLHTSFKCCIKIRDWMLVIKKLINIEEEDVRRCVLNAAFNWASSFITPVSLHSKLWNVSMPTKISPLLSTWKSANSHVKVGITYSLY